MSIEPKKTYAYDKACTGMRCDAKFTCKLYFALNYRNQVREVIRPPFVVDSMGKFKSCDELMPI